MPSWCRRADHETMREAESDARTKINIELQVRMVADRPADIGVKIPEYGTQLKWQSPVIGVINIDINTASAPITPRQ